MSDIIQFLQKIDSSNPCSDSKLTIQYVEEQLIKCQGAYIVYQRMLSQINLTKGELIHLKPNNEFKNSPIMNNF
jgi:retron-type reverse transcriptase